MPIVSTGKESRMSAVNAVVLRWSSEFRQLFWVVSRLPDPT